MSAKRSRTAAIVAAACWSLVTSAAWANVSLPEIFSDHMVLQRAANVPVWGWANPGERVKISLGRETASAVAGEDGRWETNLNLAKSESGPLQLIVEGGNRLVVEDVLVGEVWVASGQSNMEWRLSETTGAGEEMARSANPSLRFFQARKLVANEPAGQVRGNWVVAGPDTVAGVTAAGYYFAKKLQAELGVPVGILNSNWGGTPIESWTSARALRSEPELKKSSEQMWADIPDFANRQKKFAAEFPNWLKSVAREDKGSEKTADFAGMDVDVADWKPVRLPGDLSRQGLPKTGVIWLRKEVNFANKPGGDLRLTIGEADRFDALYWNGRLVKKYTHENYASQGPRREYVIPAANVQAGRNVMALRVFAPTVSAHFNREPYGMALDRPEEWVARTEVEFPDLAANSTPAPVMPATPPYPQHVAASIFNGMINPLIPYAIKGVIWYQGEANAGRAFQYRTAFPLLVQDWRTSWKQGDFPFYFCQLANFGPKKDVPAESAWAELREAQNLTLSLPNTAQAVLIDVGEAGDVHPRNKKDVGERLARIALAKEYGKGGIFSGPVYKAMKIEGDKVRLRFDCWGAKLVAAPVPETYLVAAGRRQPLVRNSPNSELEGFAVCGEDKVWHWADAAIDGDDVVVWSDQVTRPVAVRYGWADNPNINLFSDACLPASPFRTDDFTLTTANARF